MEIWEVLSELPRKLPIKTLRHLQKMVFEFVSTSKPDGKILVHGIDELDKIEELEVVVGFGNISKLQTKGLVGLKAKDLLKDILFNDIPESNHLEIVKDVLKDMIRKNVYIPFFKYQKSVRNLNENNSLKDYQYDNYTLKKANKITINDYRNSKDTKSETLMKKYKTLDALIADMNSVHAIQKIPFLDKSKIDTKILRDFLIENWEQFGNNETNYSSPYRKCICLLDFLEFANHS